MEDTHTDTILMVHIRLLLTAVLVGVEALEWAEVLVEALEWVEDFDGSGKTG